MSFYDLCVRNPISLPKGKLKDKKKQVMNYFFGSSTTQKTSGPSSPDGEARKLRVRVGPSISTLSTINVNDDTHPHLIDSPTFIGQLVIRIKNYNGPGECIKDIPYFGTKKRLFSIQLSGRFKQVKLNV